VNFQLCLQLLQYCYITAQWIQGLPAVLLVQGSGEMTVLSTCSAVLLYHNAVEEWTECKFVSNL